MVKLSHEIPEHRMNFSELQQIRQNDPVQMPKILDAKSFKVVEKEALGAAGDHEKIKGVFPTTFGLPRVELEPASPDSAAPPLRVACVLSGGQAPGGHNVIAGVYDCVKAVHPDSSLFGFLNGPHGVFTGHYVEITPEMMNKHRNTGGFDMLGSGRHKIETPEQFQASRDVCTQLDLDGLIVIGGDDSNTNAALLGEYFATEKLKTKVVGCPKTIDGDLRNKYIPISFGFDTACRVFSEQIGNVMADCVSSQKYYHFCRLMGRAASNIALECALLTRPNVCLISEEVWEKKWSLQGISEQLADVVVRRWKLNGVNHGVVLLPEGLIEFIPEFKTLIEEINEILAGDVTPSIELVTGKLSPHSKEVFCYLPVSLQMQLLLDRDPHGNVQVAQIETEKLLAMTVSAELSRRTKATGDYQGAFRPQYHSFGYEGRSGPPSLFDAEYCYALGRTAGALLSKGLTGLMVSITNLQAPVQDWICGGVPITMMCHMERRKGKDKAVIEKALVEMDGRPFQVFASIRAKWEVEDCYRVPGPLQFFGPDAHESCLTMLLENVPGIKIPGLTEEGAVEEISGGIERLGLIGDNGASVLSQDRVTKSGFKLGGMKLENMSKLQLNRLGYRPSVPDTLCGPTTAAGTFPTLATVEVETGVKTQAILPTERPVIAGMFPKTYRLPMLSVRGKPAKKQAVSTGSGAGAAAPAEAGLRIGVVFCGRQSPGGHNVIYGLHEAVRTHPHGKLYGFIGGTAGLAANDYLEVTPEVMSLYRNQGGYHLLGRSTDRIQTAEEIEGAIRSCHTLRLDALVLIGGTRTATDAAYLAERFAHIHASHHRFKTAVVAVPCTIDGTIRNHFVESTVGYDTACRVYSQLVGNTATDGASAKKYYYFMRVMGTSSSNVVAEVGLESHPDSVLIGEEIESSRRSLNDVVVSLADMICARANDGKNYGTIVIPEGVILGFPEIQVLVSELNTIFASVPAADEKNWTLEEVMGKLSPWSRALLESMPDYIVGQIVLERTKSNKNMLSLSQIETERLLVHYVADELKKREETGEYRGKFSAVCSFLGYQARASLPTNFDCDYAFTLGYTAAAIASSLGPKANGYMAVANSLGRPTKDWTVGAVPLTAILRVTDDAGPQTALPGAMPGPAAAMLGGRTRQGDLVLQGRLGGSGKKYLHVDSKMSDGIGEDGGKKAFDFAEVATMYDHIVGQAAIPENEESDNSSSSGAGDKGTGSDQSGMLFDKLNVRGSITIDTLQKRNFVGAAHLPPSVLSGPMPRVPLARVEVGSPMYDALCNSRTFSKNYETLINRPSADWYENPGPVQFFGPFTDFRVKTVASVSTPLAEAYATRLAELHRALEEAMDLCSPGCAPRVVSVAKTSATTLCEILRHMYSTPTESIDS